VSGTKYRGTATFMRFVKSAENGGGTVDIFTESRTFEVQEQAQRVDVTVRGDTAKAFIADAPEITLSTGGLDVIAGSAGTPEWDKLAVGEAGTVDWAPEGTAAGRRKRTLAVILQNKNYNSPYEQMAEWGLEFASNGGTIVHGSW
jgi:hypothetical protein